MASFQVIRLLVGWLMVHFPLQCKDNKATVDIMETGLVEMCRKLRGKLCMILLNQSLRVSPNYLFLIVWIMPVRKSDSAKLHNLWNFSKSNSVHFEMWLWLYLDRCILFSNRYQWSTPREPQNKGGGAGLILWLHRDAGLAGLAAVSVISVTCPARQPAAPPVIRLGLFCS